MKRLELKARIRTIVGKKVKNLRKKGIIPASLFGKQIKSKALELALPDFKKVYQSAGKTSLVNLHVEGEKEIHPVLIANVQIHPTSDSLLHADFHEVELKEKMKAQIPLVLTGQSLAASRKKGILIQVLNTVEIEALPTDLPEKIEVAIDALAEVNDEIKVLGLKIDTSKITILTDKNQVAVKIGPLEEIQPAPTPVTEAEPVAGEESTVEAGIDTGEEAAQPTAETKPQPKEKNPKE